MSEIKAAATSKARVPFARQENAENNQSSKSYSNAEAWKQGPTVSKCSAPQVGFGRSQPYGNQRSPPTLRPLQQNQQQKSPVGPKTLNGIPLPTKIFVGGISENTREGNVQDFFQKYGHVRSVRIITDRSIGLKNGEPRRYAFVEFADPDEVQKVLAGCGKLDIELDGRRLNIGPAYRKPTTFNMTFEPNQSTRSGDSQPPVAHQSNTSPMRNMGAQMAPQMQATNGMYTQQQIAAIQQMQAAAAYGYYPMSYPVYGNGYAAMNGGMVPPQYYNNGYMQQAPYYGQNMGYAVPTWTPSPQGSPPNGSPQPSMGVASLQGSPPRFDTENQPPQQAYYAANGAVYGYGNMGQQAMVNGYSNGQYQVVNSASVSPNRQYAQPQPVYGSQNYGYGRYGAPVAMQAADRSFG